MKLYDVYNDGGFVMRSTLPMIARVFDLHPDAVERIKREEVHGEGYTDLHINRGKFAGMVARVFAATVDLPARSPDIFGSKE